MENVSTGTHDPETKEQAVLEKLPVARTIQQAVLLVAGTTGSGSRDATTISGALSYENLCTVNGVVNMVTTSGGTRFAGPFRAPSTRKAGTAGPR